MFYLNILKLFILSVNKLYIKLFSNNKAINIKCIYAIKN